MSHVVVAEILADCVETNFCTSLQYEEIGENLHNII